MCQLVLAYAEHAVLVKCLKPWWAFIILTMNICHIIESECFDFIVSVITDQVEESR